MKELTVKRILDSQYIKLTTAEKPYTRTQLLYTIITIKADSDQSLIDYNQSIYLDIKFFMDSYVESLKTQAFGYDSFDLNRIFNLYSLVSSKEAISLNNHLHREIRLRGYEAELNETKRKGDQLHLMEYKNTSFFLYAIRYVMFLSSRGILNLILTILIILLVYTIILLPAPKYFLPLFEITYDNYTETFWLNHIVNLVAGSLDLGCVFNIRALNLGGVTLLIVGKLISILIVGNYLLQELYKRLSD